ncbi:hypothetical protein AB1287_05205 [Enterobacter asburiae]
MAKSLDELLKNENPEVLAEAERSYQELRKEYDKNKNEEQDDDNA